MGIDRRENGKAHAKIKIGALWFNIGTYDSDDEARAACAAEYERVRNGTSILTTPNLKTVAVKDFAARIGVPLGTMRRWISEGCPTLTVGRTVRLDEAIASAWIAEHHPKSVSFARESHVYFVRRERDEAIKIGFTSDVVRRMHELKRDEKCPVVLLAAVPGDKPTELRLHARFAAHRIDKEWFAPAAEILAFVASLSIGRSAA